LRETNEIFMKLANLLRGISQFRASSYALIAANMLPLLGVIFLQWDAFSIVALYWFENVIIGVINVLKMLTCSPDLNTLDFSRFQQNEEFRRKLEEAKSKGELDNLRLMNHGSKLFFIPFFIVHYGLFCMVHGVFVFAFFARDSFFRGPFELIPHFADFVREKHVTWAILALIASHLVSFFTNYIGRGEYRRTVVPILMFAPYARVVVLHIALLLGGFFVMFLGSPAPLLFLLIIGKTILDLALHLREHERIPDDTDIVMKDLSAS
jgi:hypothetical protein